MMDKNDPRRAADAGGGGGGSARSGSHGVSPTLIAFAVIVVLAVIFFLQNGEKTELDFLFFETQNKTRWLVIISVLIGVVLDRLFSMWWRRRRRNER